mgnify:CR=1 FL=1
MEKKLEFTDSAKNQIEKITKSDEKKYFRIAVQGGGCSGLSYGMGLEKEPEDDDIVIEENGVKLVIDSYSINHLEGASVDYVESLLGSGFKITNPNVKKSCSCGSSFST